MQRMRLATIVAVLSIANPAWAQSKKNDFGKETGNGKGPQLGAEHVERWRIGVTIVAGGGPCTDISGFFQLPVDWPEQQVKVIEEEISPFFLEKDYRMVDTVKEMTFAAPQLPAGQEARISLTFEIRRSTQSPPEDTKSLKKLDAKKLPKDLRRYLGPSPRIESNSGKIKSLAKKLAKENEGKTDWEKVEAIFQWVREHVKQEEGPKQPGALQALRDEASDHEGLTSLFVALCRASEVPARTVWIPKSSYPEFYLADDEGQGHWFPCWLAEPFIFGGVEGGSPIWQKGDNFRPADKTRETVRYLQSWARYKEANKGETKVTFVRELVTLAGQ